MKKIVWMICILFTLSASAQISPYLEKGTSGGGIFTGYEAAKGFDGVYGNIDYSHKGKLDLSLCLFQGYYNKNQEGLTNPDATSFYYSGSLSWWFLREKPIENIGVNVALTAGYEADDYKGYTTANGIISGYYGGWAGVNFNLGFNLPNQWEVQSIFINNFGFGYDQYTESNEAKQTFYYGVSSNVGASVIKKLKNGHSIVATFLHSVATYNDGSYFDVKIGYIFSLN